MKTMFKYLKTYNTCKILYRTFSKALRSGKVKRGETKLSFVDVKRVRVLGGKGGDGCISFLQLCCNANAGPDGGDGGNGGHASEKISSLVNVNSVLKASDGENGMNRDCHGRNAENLFISVPLGTMIKNKNGRMLADLKNNGNSFLAARGGSGGKGNHFFADSSEQTPKVAEYGALGENCEYILEMSVIAHIGLVGFPNAGKSTLLRAISRARPRVASYPFTTLQPYIGVVEYSDYEKVNVADIPGLIPNAHKNRGLGMDFLRHIRRCVCLLYVLDASQPNVQDHFNVLRYELEQYNNGLSKKPYAIVANKIDLPEANEQLSIFEEKNIEVFPISAKYNYNIEKLLKYVRYLYDHYKLSYSACKSSEEIIK